MQALNATNSHNISVLNKYMSLEWGAGQVKSDRLLEPKLEGLENEYRQHFLREDAAHWTIIMALAQVPVIATADLDYRLYGWALPFYLLSLGRTVFFSYCVFVMFVLRKIRNPETYDKLALSVAILGVLLTLAIDFSRPPTYAGHLVLEVPIILVFYLVWPNTLLVRILPPLFLSVGIIALLLFSKTVETPIVFKNALVAFFWAHVLGIAASTRLNNYRRGQFKAQKELEKVQQVLAELASTDALTGILNRRKFMEFAKTEFSRFRRYGTPLTLVMVDLDHFKEINDNFGHSVGDEFLKEFARIVMKDKRETDLFGRLGGEEFGLLLPESSLELAYKVSERLRQHCEEICIGKVPRVGFKTVSRGDRDYIQ